MSQLWEDLVTSPYLVPFVGGVFGLLQSIAGYRLFKATLGFVGFVGGALLAASAVQVHATAWWVPLAAALIGGAMGAFLLPALYFVGVFLAGAFLGGIVGFSLGDLFSLLLAQVLAAVLALIAAIVAVKAQRFMIILSTAFGGAWIALASVASWPGGRFEAAPFRHEWMLPGFLLWAAIGLIGTLIQFRGQRAAAPAPPPAR